VTTLHDQIIDAMQLALLGAIAFPSPDGPDVTFDCGQQSTERYARDLAAIFYGMVQQANGPWEEIVRAARAADCVCGDPSDYKEHPFTLDAFVSALILEGLWRGRGEAIGPSWFNEHTRPDVGPCEWCGCLEPHDRDDEGRDDGVAYLLCRNGFHECDAYAPRFTVPPLTFNREEGI
jgi:hypothetical protein